MANLNAAMPTYATPFLTADGRINEPWYRFLFQLQIRTGGAAGTDFVTDAEFQALVATVANQDREINGLYPTAPVIAPSGADPGTTGLIPIPAPDAVDAGAVPFPPGTVGQQNSDSVAITGGSIDGTTIGASVPSSGAFTTLTATTPVAITSGGTGASSASGARTNLGLGTIATQNANAVAITGGNVDGTAIGATTASSGAFTTITASSTITPSQTAGIVGTTTNNNANAGSVGEFVSATSGATSLSTGVQTNLTSVSLTAGDWDVEGNVWMQPQTGDTMTLFQAGISTTSASVPAVPLGSVFPLSIGPGLSISSAAPEQRISLSGTTTVYLVVVANHSGGTLNATGNIRARRVR